MVEMLDVYANDRILDNIMKLLCFNDRSCA